MAQSGGSIRKNTVHSHQTGDPRVADTGCDLIRTSDSSTFGTVLLIG